MDEAPDPRRTHPPGADFGTWNAADGWVLRRMDWRQAAGAKARGSLIFLGGRGDFIEKYIEAHGYWHGRGWNVTGFDWRGQGASRGAGYNFASFDPMVEDGAALIADWWAKTPGPHVAIGHSMGGHLLLRLLADRRVELDAAVLVAPMIMVNSAPIPGWLAPAVAATMCALGFARVPMWKTPAALQRPGSQRQRFLTGSRERYEDEAWWWAKQPGWNLGAPTWGWLRAAVRSAKAFAPERLAGVRLPVLLIAAAHDRLVSTPAIRRTAAELPDAELEVYEQAAHEILRDADPVRLAALARIDRFFDERAP